MAVDNMTEYRTNGILANNMAQSQVQSQLGNPTPRNLATNIMKESSTNIFNLAANSGERPPSIDNTDIEGEHPGQLHPNLIMYRDFVMLPELAWRILQSWYGGGPEYPRKVIIHNSIPSIELYPPRITCVLSDHEGKPISDS